MAKKLVHICDGKDCGAVLINSDDGFVITGAIRTSLIEGGTLVSAPPVVANDPTPETALCRDCMASALGFLAKV